jgi:hypothetical protein
LKASGFCGDSDFGTTGLGVLKLSIIEWRSHMSKLLAMAALATMIATNALAYGGGGFGHTTGAGVAHYGDVSR